MTLHLDDSGADPKGRLIQLVWSREGYTSFADGRKRPGLQSVPRGSLMNQIT
jgi:hypothetical protein